MEIDNSSYLCTGLGQASIWLSSIADAILRSSTGCTQTKRTTHLVSGIAAGAAISAFAGGGDIEFLLVGGLFGILPDFDIALTPLWARAHRSAGSHSLLAAACMAAAWYIIVRTLVSDLGLFDTAEGVVASAATAFAAAFVHAAEDALTKQGCLLLYPLSRRRFRGPVRYDDLVANTALTFLAFAVIVGFSGLLL
jgi:membrane-bound metal-dependent hydrolase YbcI (DUF457 family)